ncbi:hypothetical protein [Escherichia phage vB_EcoS_ULIM2]|nr:hypothetical protein [Escherichia phage vB_EcoS_ULIM2]
MTTRRAGQHQILPLTIIAFSSTNQPTVAHHAIITFRHSQSITIRIIPHIPQLME